MDHLPIQQRGSMAQVQTMLQTWVLGATPPPLDLVSIIFWPSLLNWVVWSSQAWFSVQFAKRLRASGVVERIAFEGLPAQRVIDFVPRYLRWMFPNLLATPKTLEGSLKEINLNLDWYLEPPRPVVRWHWIAPFVGVGLIGLGILGMAATVSSGVPAEMWFFFVSYLLFGLGVPAGMILLFLPKDVRSVRERMMRGVFAEELLARMGVPLAQDRRANRSPIAFQRPPVPSDKPAWLRKREALPDDDP